MPDGRTPEGLSRLRHDLRTPLTVVIGFAEIMAAERPLSDAERRDYAERVLSAAIEIRELIDGARLEEPPPGVDHPSSGRGDPAPAADDPGTVP